MRIATINNDNRKSSVTFGYNKSLNEKVIEQLSKEAPEFSNTMLTLNKFCNDTETLLAEKLNSAVPNEKGYYDAVTETILNAFIEAKGAFAMAINKHFPKLKYPLIEAKQYKLDAGGNNESWRLEVSDFLRVISKVAKKDDDIETGTTTVIKTIQKVETENQNDAGGYKSYQGKDIKAILPEMPLTDESPVSLSSLGGMKELKETLIDKIIYPIKEPEMAKLDEKEYGKKFPRATLLYGPPGCGKTFVAEAIAREANVPVFMLKVGKASSVFQNETALNYEAAFDAVEQRSKEIGKPCILFLDEIEGLTPDRGNQHSSPEDSKNVGALLDLINSARSRNIIVVGATNKYKVIDEAIRNRFDTQLYVGLPDKNTRVEVLKKTLQNRIKAIGLLASSEDLEAIAEKFDKFSNRSIVDLSNAVSNIARKEGRRDIAMADYFKIISDNQSLKITNEAQYQIVGSTKMDAIGFGAPRYAS